MTANLFDQPGNRAFARRTDPETSKAAAKSVKPKKVTELRTRILKTFRERGAMTDETLCAYVQQETGGEAHTDSSIRTRRSELVAAGQVKWTGQKERMTTGGLARVWAVNE